MRSGQGERGQAATEYVAIVAVLAVLLVAGAATFAPTTVGGLANAAVGGMRRALCVVTGSQCSAQRPQPCVTASDSERRRLSLSLGIYRLDDDHLLLRERLSDGRVRLTVARDVGAGVELALGGGGRLKAGRVAVAVGAELRGALLAILGRGRVFHAASEQEADELQERIGRDPPLVLKVPVRVVRRILGKREQDRPEPDETYREGGLRALADLGVARKIASLQLSALADTVIGARRDRRSGELTVYLRLARSADALVNATLGASGDVGAGGATGAEGVLALRLDAARRPVALTLLGSARADGEVRLPAPLEGLVDAGPGRRWELHAELDLTVPAARDAWSAFTRAPSRDALVALGVQLRERGRLDTRTYASEGSEEELTGRLALGAGVGFGSARVRERLRLLAASTRPPGGAWERRDDCLAASG